jgi:hypothetical protein
VANSWDSAPMVIIPAPVRAACPYCGETRPAIIQRSASQGDGTTTRKSICRTCSGWFLVIVEPVPAAGSEVVWPA